MIFNSLDQVVISRAQKMFLPMARVSLFVVYFWFGILKIFDTSPANPLVSDLLDKTLPFITFGQFIVFFSIFEMIIGLAFLIPALNRLALVLLVPHMITTFMPLVFLPVVAWSATMTPTLEGQYIIKNLVIIALAIGIAARLTPLRANAPSVAAVGAGR